MSTHLPPDYPRHCWYVVATSDEVDSNPLGRRALDTAIVLFRTSAGQVTVLEDRDAHRPYPLSTGRVEDDLLICAYSGFAYRADGVCVRVPTQPEVPYGARVRRFPAVEQDDLVWVWFAEPGLAALRRPPRMPWLTGNEVATFGDQWTTSANYLLLHKNLADITHVAMVSSVLVPPVLSAGPVPQLNVEVTETTVSFRRDFEPATLAPWQAELLGAIADTKFVQHERGQFVSPGLWVDRWGVDLPDSNVPSSDLSNSVATFTFTHLITPVDRCSTRHIWRVSRNFALNGQPSNAPVSQQLAPMFGDYYRAVQRILETMQEVLITAGPRPDIGVAADAASLQVERIVRRMVRDEISQTNASSHTSSKYLGAI